jgi:hypothetical protein
MVLKVNGRKVNLGRAYAHQIVLFSVRSQHEEKLKQGLSNLVKDYDVHVNGKGVVAAHSSQGPRIILFGQEGSEIKYIKRNESEASGLCSCEAGESGRLDLKLDGVEYTILYGKFASVQEKLLRRACDKGPPMPEQVRRGFRK